MPCTLEIVPIRQRIETTHVGEFLQVPATDDVVNVLVFTRPDPDYFISHVDVTRIEENGRRPQSWSPTRRWRCCFAI